jgi:hypothetical protein
MGAFLQGGEWMLGDRRKYTFYVEPSAVLQGASKPDFPLLFSPPF